MSIQARIFKGNAPFGQCSVVADTSIHPACAGWRLFFFPEGRLSFKIVHQKFTGLKALGPVRRSHHHQHNLIQWRKQTHAVDDAGARIDLTVTFNGDTVLGKAQVRVTFA